MKYVVVDRNYNINELVGIVGDQLIPVSCPGESRAEESAYYHRDIQDSRGFDTIQGGFEGVIGCPGNVHSKSKCQ